jgi:hypothetical protein
MAGNEIEITHFLLNNLGTVTLKHLGLVNQIGAPNSKGGFTKVNTTDELALISTEDAAKKADIYINGRGVSLKQSGASFPFNRLQRAELLKVFQIVGFENPEAKLARIDKEVDDFHKGHIENRSRPWQNLFDEADFKRLVKFLMMEGSPNLGYSSHPAEFILEAPATGISKQKIQVFTFDEYFDVFKKNLFFAIRRQWIGQSSDSEHSRATGLANKAGNQQWVYKTISGQPRISNKTGKRWRDDIPEKERRTVYMIFVEKNRKILG